MRPPSPACKCPAALRRPAHSAAPVSSMCAPGCRRPGAHQPACASPALAAHSRTPPFEQHAINGVAGTWRRGSPCCKTGAGAAPVERPIRAVRWRRCLPLRCHTACAAPWGLPLSVATLPMMLSAPAAVPDLKVCAPGCAGSAGRGAQESSMPSCVQRGRGNHHRHHHSPTAHRDRKAAA